MSENVTKRQLILSGSITDDVVGNLVRDIVDINIYDDEEEEKKRRYKREPIRLIIDSYGGSVYDGIALIGAIESSKTPVDTVCLGQAMSAAFYVFLSGRRRSAHYMSVVMYHLLSSAMDNTLSIIKDRVGELERLQRICDEYVIKRTRITKEMLSEVRESGKEWYIYPDLMRELGIVSKVF